MRVIYLEVEDNMVDKVVNALKGLKVRFRMEQKPSKRLKNAIEELKKGEVEEFNSIDEFMKDLK